MIIELNQKSQIQRDLGWIRFVSMFPVIPNVTGYYKTDTESGRVSIGSKNLSAVKQNHSYSNSSRSPECRAARIQRNVDAFLTDQDTQGLDISVFHRLLGNRFVGGISTSKNSYSKPSTRLGYSNRVVYPPPKVFSDHCSSFTNTSVEKRAVKILQDVHQFLTLPGTITPDGNELYGHLENKFVGRPSATQELAENFEVMAEGIFDFQAKKIASDLLFRGIICSEEYRFILSKFGSGRHQTAVVLLDTLLSPSIRRSSPDQVAGAFKDILRDINPALAKRVFHN